MTPQTATPKKTVQMTVFDLVKFDSVKLAKEFTIPAKPTTLEEALAAVGNDAVKLLDVIHEGLISEATDAAKSTIEGFHTLEDESKLTDSSTWGAAYAGPYADEQKEKAINLAILNIAKAGGFDKSLPLEVRNKLKADAMEFIRANPAMIAFIAGTAAK